MYKKYFIPLFILIFVIGVGCPKRRPAPEEMVERGRERREVVVEEEDVEPRRGGAVAGVVIEDDTEFEGIIQTDGDVTIAGRVKGTIIAAGTITVEKTGVVECDSMIATEIIIDGHVRGGRVTAVGNITVTKTGILEGEHHQKELVVEPGAIVDSKSRMGGYKK